MTSFFLSNTVEMCIIILRRENSTWSKIDQITSGTTSWWPKMKIQEGTHQDIETYMPMVNPTGQISLSPAAPAKHQILASLGTLGGRPIKDTGISMFPFFSRRTMHHKKVPPAS